MKPVAAEAPLDELFGQNARDRLNEVKRGLRAILDLLAGRPPESVDVQQRPAPRRKRSA
jgi:hypothetical protein